MSFMNIKRVLKSVLNMEMVNYLKSIKIKYFPSAYEIKFFQSQKELLERRSNFYSNYIKPGELCFDVGANIGNRVDAFLNIGARVIAIEPQEDCVSVLEKKYGKKIQIVNKGVGAKEEFLDFYTSQTSVLSSFSTDWIKSVEISNRFSNSNWNKVQKIEITTLDKLINKFGLPVFIKIDVEGYENEVLMGLSHQIKTLSFEYTVPEQTVKAISCIEKLENIDREFDCNYCTGESMEMILNHWLSPTDMKELISDQKFTSSGFGDIYIRFKNI